MLRFVVPLVSLSLCCSAAHAFSFDDFADAQGLQLNGAAKVQPDSRLLGLTPAAPQKRGSVFTTYPVEARGFSTSFSFRIRHSGGNQPDCLGKSGGEGLTFVIQRQDPSALGQAAGGLGYAGIGRPAGQDGSSIGVEFDTACDADTLDPSSAHVALVEGGSALHSTLPVASVPHPFDDGSLWHVWIDYSGRSDLLEVRMSRQKKRPASALLSWPISLPLTIGGNSGYAGFTAATGYRYAEHDIANWTYLPMRFADSPPFNSASGGMDPPVTTDGGPPPKVTQIK